MDRSASKDGYAIGGGEKVSSMTSMTRSSKNYKEKSVKRLILTIWQIHCKLFAKLSSP